MTYATKELGSETWPDFERLFAPGTGWAFCACMFFQRSRHLREAEFPGREAMRVQNQAEKRVLVDEGRAHGILVYDDGEPVGSCQYGPLEELPIPGGGRTSRRIPPAGANVRWRITCFVTGGGLVEAYPPVTPLRANWDHGGTISMFEREGFTVVARPNAPYVVMRRVVSGIRAT